MKFCIIITGVFRVSLISSQDLKLNELIGHGGNINMFIAIESKNVNFFFFISHSHCCTVFNYFPL